MVLQEIFHEKYSSRDFVRIEPCRIQNIHFDAQFRINCFKSFYFLDHRVISR